MRPPETGLNAQDLVQKRIYEFRNYVRWVIPHNITVACIRNQDKLSLWKGLENFIEQELADAQRGADVAEVQRTIVKGASRVVLVDEIHVIASHLLRSGGQIMEPEVRKSARPIGVDVYNPRVSVPFPRIGYES